MALRRSTGLINELMGTGEPPYDAIWVNSGLGLIVNSADSTDRWKITATRGDFITDGFNSGGLIGIYGQSHLSAWLYVLCTVSATTMRINGDTGTVTSVFNSAGGDSCAYAIVQIKRGRIKDVFRDGVIRFYSGSQPANADAAETGSLLVTISLGSGTFVSNEEANGLKFGSASGASEYIAKAAGETWSGTAVATGTAGWFRFYSNALDTGADTGAPKTAIRFDGALGTSGAEINLSSLTITSGATITLDDFNIGVPLTA